MTKITTQQYSETFLRWTLAIWTTAAGKCPCWGDPVYFWLAWQHILGIKALLVSVDLIFCDILLCSDGVDDSIHVKTNTYQRKGDVCMVSWLNQIWSCTYLRTELIDKPQFSTVMAHSGSPLP